MSRAPKASLKHRHDQLRREMDAVSLDALVVTSLANVTYLTNFTGTAAVVVLTPTRVIFLTDSRYVTALADAQAADHACPDLDVVVVAGSYDGALAQTICERGWQRVGFEAAHLTVSRFRWFEEQLTRAAGVTLIPTEGLAEHARVTKDEYELGVLREAGRRLSVAADRVLREIHGGMTERDAAFHIEACLRDAGFSKPAFETIVASGPNSALPHARPTERRLTESDLVVLDFGGVYDSYCVDLTRTVAIRPASDRSRAVHRAVLAAHAGAVAAAGPGQSRFAIDAAARDVLAAAGMGEAFGHGTGHGLGLEIHEDPRIVRRRPDVDARDEFVGPGMVFTIEPGAYFPGWGGVRIEDDVVVTERGVELLTHVTTELLELSGT